MGMTLQGFVYDNAGNAIAGATVQGYESADNATAVAEASTTTDTNGKWAITTTDASHIPMDIKITYGANHRWLKAGDKVNLTDMTVSGTLTVGEDNLGHDVQLFGATTGRSALWDESEDAFHLNDNTELKIGSLAAGDMVLYHDGTNSYIKNATGALKLATESSGIAVTIGHTTSNVTIGQNLIVTGTLTLGSGAVLSEAELEMLDGITAGTAAASKALVLDANKDIGTIRNLTIDGTLSDGNYTFDTSGNVSGLGTVTGTTITGSTAIVGGTVAGTTGTFSGVVDVTDATDSSDATGDTGALKTEGGASIAKKLYVGTDVSVGNDLTVAGDLTVSGDTITVNTATLAVEDPLIALATGNNAADALDIGIYGLYDTSGSQDEYSGLFRDATDEKWKLFQDLQVAPTTTVNTGGTGYAVGTLVATLEGNADTVTTNANLTGDVTSSGSNATAIAAGVIIDNDVNASAAIAYSKLAALADGNILVGNGSGVAVSVNPSGDVDITNAGVFSIASDSIINADIKSDAAIADSKLATISTADKVSAAAIQVDGATDGTGITIVDADKLLIDDAGATKYITASQLGAYIVSEGSMSSFQLEDDSGDEVTINNANEVKFIGSGVDINWTDTDNGTDGDPYDLTFTLDFSDLSTVTPVDGDFFATLDSDGANEQKTTTTALATLLAGTGLTASSSVIGVDAAQTQITSVGDLGTGTIASGFGVIDNGTSGIRTNTFTAETSIIPSGVGTADIGSTSAEWGDVFIADDKAIKFGNGQDATIEYDENGTDQLRIAGSTIFEDQVQLDKSILVDSTPADGVYSGITGTFTAGETLSVGECVYLKASDTKMYKAVSAAGGTGLISPDIMCVAVAAAAITADDPGVFLLQGFITSSAFPTYAIGETLYLPEAEQSSLNVPEGAVPDSAGDFVQVLGWASASNTIFFNPDFTIIEHAG